MRILPNDKKRQVRQKLKVGSIFSVDLHNGKFAFGRCITKLSIGHLVEIFDYLSSHIELDSSKTQKRLFDPIIIDSYSLFSTKKKEGNWHIIEQQDTYIPTQVDHLKYTYGTGNERYLTDIWGNKTIISKEASLKYPVYSPKGDLDVIEMIESANQNEHI